MYSLCLIFYTNKLLTKKAEFNPEFDLELNSSNDKHKQFLSSYADLKLQLPEIKRIKIDTLVDNDDGLNGFLTHSVPHKLKLLCLNHCYNSDYLLKIKYYIDSFKQAAKKVTKEIYIENCEVEEDELEHIVRSSSQTERLTIRVSKLHSNRDLDFAIDPPYKTEYISFINCGLSRVSMKWDTHPDRFERIIKAISNCGLKESLQTINVGCCRIGKVKAQELLKSHGLNSVTAIEELNDPLSN